MESKAECPVATGEISMDLYAAADFLHLSPAVLRQKAKAGIIPGAKPGKCWVFLQSDLVSYLRSLYAGGEQVPRGDWKEVIPCQSINAETFGGLDLPHQTASRYADLLELPTENSR